jgi:protein TonB
MDFSEHDRQPGKKLTGIAAVILFHILIVYALMTGLARKVVEVIQQPIETRIIEEVKPPPKEIPPPPSPPKRTAPPPPFVPRPEVPVQQPVQQNTIAAVSDVKPETPVAPTAPPSQHVDAKPAPPVNTPAVVDFNSCAKPEYPRNSQRNEEQGTVVLAFLIGVDGQVIDSKVEKTSGFKDLDKAARSALSLCRFKPGMIDGRPQQSWTKVQYVWRLD